MLAFIRHNSLKLNSIIVACLKSNDKFVNIIMQRISESFSLFIFMFKSVNVSCSFIKSNSSNRNRFNWINEGIIERPNSNHALSSKQA